MSEREFMQYISEDEACDAQKVPIAVFDEGLFFLDKNVISHNFANLDAEGRLDAIERECRLLRQQLMAGTSDGACAFFAGLAAWAERGSLPLPELRAAVDRMTLMLTDAALQTELSVRYLREFYRRIQQEGDTLPALINRLRMDLPAMARELGRLQQTRGDLLERMLAYISRCGMNYDFSIQAMADAFAMPQSELSRLFQYRTGQKLGAYLWERRLREARRLLIQTEYSIKEVVRQVGYVDTSSFTRKFRRSVGCTPGEYRIRYRQLRVVPGSECAAAI